MRLWSIDPAYYDTKALTACWREGLLAQKVLAGKTKGYRSHPQLERFKAHPQQLEAIAMYLCSIWHEANVRGYNFNEHLIEQDTDKLEGRRIMSVTLGQLEYEAHHLRRKLFARQSMGRVYLGLGPYKCHPFFYIVSGPVAPWEKGAHA